MNLINQLKELLINSTEAQEAPQSTARIDQRSLNRHGVAAGLFSLLAIVSLTVIAATSSAAASDRDVDTSEIIVLSVENMT